ncbi:MAG: TonB-dependent receptor [Planctomycetota bacterium]|nr:TonB-dependent receptor [Planctomycetota bacterium]
MKRSSFRQSFEHTAVWATLIVLFTVTAFQTHAQAQPESSKRSRTVETRQIADGAVDEDSPEASLQDIEDLNAFLDADLEQLAASDVVVPVFTEHVTTVSRNESTVGQSAAAISVITNEMIRRSGARSLPEALRLAPGVNVARIDANKWAISIRGFNQRFANKLLVQIDGRTIYTPLFGGVFWDVQDVLMEDVDRIEIIRGPGATVWGANAVNGVINVITKPASATTGTFVEGGGGNQRSFASARIGRQDGDLAWRAFGKWFENNAGLRNGVGAGDDWRMQHFGIRSDWTPGEDDTFTLQGDFYQGDAGQLHVQPIPATPFRVTANDNQSLQGGNILGRWTHTIDDESNWSLQFYYEHTDRSLDGTGFREQRDTLDVDFQHQFNPIDDHRLTWGLGFRNTKDRIDDSFQLRFTPHSRSDNRFGTFLQDEITLVNDLLKMTVGSKFSWNDYTGSEIQPTARLLFTPTNRQTIWASVSRAVRVPSRATDDIRLTSAPGGFPVFPTLIGNRAGVSEELLAWELGMRSAPTDEFFWDVATFFNQYDSLQSVSPGVPGIDPVTGLFAVPLGFSNSGVAQTYGFEAASTVTFSPDWMLRGGYSFLRVDATDVTAEGQSPRNQLFLHSSWDLTSELSLDLTGRYTDSLSTIQIPAYFEMDARIAWMPRDGLEFAIVGRNLLDSAHPEYESDAFTGVFASQIRRELYASVTWRF